MSTKKAAVSSAVIDTATRERCTILLNLSMTTKMPVRPCASAGKPNTKSILTELQTFVAIGSVQSGVCDDGDGFTR